MILVASLAACFALPARSPLLSTTRARTIVCEAAPVADACIKPEAAKECWRPTLDDVDRISWGRPAKRKGTGSRGVPHRLNDEERVLFDFARTKGFVEIAGSGWRRQRSDSPLVNTYRNWCDARGVCAIFLHKGNEVDEVVVDVSPLRTPEKFEDAALYCLSKTSVPGGILHAGQEIANESADVSSDVILQARADEYTSLPLYRLPMYIVSWECPRSEAKVLAKSLAQLLGTAMVKKGRSKKLGGPKVKPGKSRRHGGYGIG